MISRLPFPANAEEEMHRNLLYRRGEKFLTSVWTLKWYEIEPRLQDASLSEEYLAHVRLCYRITEWLEQTFPESEAVSFFSQHLLQHRLRLGGLLFLTLGHIHLTHREDPYIGFSVEAKNLIEQLRSQETVVWSGSAREATIADQTVDRIFLHEHPGFIMAMLFSVERNKVPVYAISLSELEDTLDQFDQEHGMASSPVSLPSGPFLALRSEGRWSRSVMHDDRHLSTRFLLRASQFSFRWKLFWLRVKEWLGR